MDTGPSRGMINPRDPCKLFDAETENEGKRKARAQVQQTTTTSLCREYQDNVRAYIEARDEVKMSDQKLARLARDKRAP